MSDEVEDVEVSETPKPKMVPLSELIEVRNKYKDTQSKLNQFMAAEEEKKNNELSESEKWRKKYEEQLTVNQQNEIKQKKTSSFMEAKAKIGEGYELPDENKLFAQWMKTAYNPDTHDSDIEDLFEITKRPKKQNAQVINLGASNVATKDAKDYTGAELRQLQNSDPDRFKIVMAERKR